MEASKTGKVGCMCRAISEVRTAYLSATEVKAAWGLKLTPAVKSGLLDLT